MSQFSLQFAKRHSIQISVSNSTLHELVCIIAFLLGIKFQPTPKTCFIFVTLRQNKSKTIKIHQLASNCETAKIVLPVIRSNPGCEINSLVLNEWQDDYVIVLLPEVKK